MKIVLYINNRSKFDYITTLQNYIKIYFISLTHIHPKIFRKKTDSCKMELFRTKIVYKERGI